jgi:hypothetical protein
MGHTTTPKYQVVISEDNGTWRSAWDSKHDGRPTDANLARYIGAYEASMQPGEVNEHLSQHLDHAPTVYSAMIRYNTGYFGAEVATYQK